MKQGIIEKIVSEEIDRHEEKVFTEFKTEIMLSKNKIVGIYLGNLKRFENRYVKPEDIPLSDGKREIQIKVESIHEPVAESQLERGFEFFRGLNQKLVGIEWRSIAENLKKSPKTYTIFEFADSFNRQQDKKSNEIYCCRYDMIPLIEIGDEIEKIKRFMNYCKEGVDFEKASLRAYPENQGFTLRIGRNLFDFQTIGTNSDTKKYAKTVDEFLSG